MKTLFTGFFVWAFTFVVAQTNGLNTVTKSSEPTIKFNIATSPQGISRLPNSGVGGKTIVSHAPVVDFSGNRIIKSVYKTVENPTDSAITFWFADFPQTDSAFLNDYIWKKVTNPADTQGTRLEIMNACAEFLKNSYYHTNSSLIFDGQWVDDLLYAKEHSLIGRIYSTYSTQCGNNSLHASIIQLMFPGYFSIEEFGFASVPGHSFTNTIINGRQAHTDYDVGTCGFMFKNAQSPNGWASTEDLIADSSLINSKFLINGQDLCPQMSLSQYNTALSSGPVIIGGIPYKEPVKLNGFFILPPHSSVETSPVGPVFFLDTSIATNTEALQNIQALVGQAQQGCAYCYDSIVNTMERLWSVDSSMVSLVLKGAPVVLYNPLLLAGRPFSVLIRDLYDRDAVPYWILHTNNTDTLNIGTDIKMPLFVLEAENCEVGDTAISEKTVFPLWVGGPVPNKLTYREVNYLESGKLYPGEHHLKLSVNANAAFISVLSEWNIAGGEGLIFNTVTDLLNQPVTGIRPVIPNQNQFKAWLSGARTLTVNADCDVYNTTGQLVMHLTKGSKDVSGLALGLYVVAPSVGGTGAIKVAVY